MSRLGNHKKSSRWSDRNGPINPLIRLAEKLVYCHHLISSQDKDKSATGKFKKKKNRKLSDLLPIFTLRKAV